ncbi:hypothetical protein [uncultured Erythrobacter sp.]|uniref:hypothetical protein n=1 Tax=uncultured Erythrobacter sp. TaxID=263913 RepID=UPI00260F40D4|nr:hypothetical protein [uncultured Erythrobacter sp.]
MTTFEWTVIGLILFGMVIPFWVMTVFAIILAEQARKQAKPSDRPIKVHDYSKLMTAFDELLHQPNKNGKFNGPTMVAYIRELREYPQYRDATLLFLEEISITGSNEFDEVCKTELKSIETHLLGLNDE